MPVSVKRLDATAFEVEVTGQATTTHRVTASPEYVQKLAGGKASAEQLVEASFEFLLKREPNTSILRSFDLPVIQSYFPEYEATIRQQLG